MGDRNVVGIRQPGADTLYLYSHWGGEDQENTLAGALVAAMSRWDDDAYATRILVSHYVAEDWRKETGYGLMVGSFPDPDYDYIYEVDWSDRMVYRVQLDEQSNPMPHGDGDYSYPFNVFIGEHFGKDGA